jgi:WhiB family transcriptional regulator, redox-sensing transcriptional regulator
MPRNSLDNPDVGTERQESLESDLDPHFMDLLEASSLGTPAASRIRAATPANVVDDVRRRLMRNTEDQTAAPIRYADARTAAARPLGCGRLDVHQNPALTARPGTDRAYMRPGTRQPLARGTWVIQPNGILVTYDSKMLAAVVMPSAVADLHLVRPWDIGAARTYRQLAVQDVDHPALSDDALTVVTSAPRQGEAPLVTPENANPLLNAGWRQDALCSQDPELFQVEAAQNQAKLICRGCPVRTECLAEALDSGNEFGVWGGMTERERRALLQRRHDVTSWRDLLERARDRYLREGIDASAGGTADAPHVEQAHPPTDAQPVAVRVARPADLQLCLVSPEHSDTGQRP